MNNKYKLIKLLLVLPLFLSLNSFSNNDSIEVGQVWKLNVRSSASMNGSGEVLYQIASDAYHTHRARIFDDWDVFSVVDSRDLVRLRKGYEIQVSEKLYSIYFKNFMPYTIFSQEINDIKKFFIQNHLVDFFKTS